MPLVIRLAWRNLWRQRRRSLITAVAMAIAVALCMAMVAFNDGVYSKLFDVMVNQLLGHIQVHQIDYPAGRQLSDTVPNAGAMLTEFEHLPHITAVTGRLNGFGLIGGSAESVGGQLVGVLPEREATVTHADQKIIEGRFLSVEPSREILLGAGLAQDIEVVLGDSVVIVTQAADGSLGNNLYKVVGIYKTGNTRLDKSGSMLHLYDLQELLVLPDQVHQLTLLTDAPENLDAIRDSLTPLLPQKVQAQTWKEASPQTAQMMDMQSAAQGLVLAIVFAVSSFGIVNTMLMSVMERTREFGLLKALGLRPRQITLMVVVEAVLLAAVAGIIGLFLGAIMDLWLLTRGFDVSAGAPDGLKINGVTLDPVLRGEVHPEGVLTILAALFTVSILASLWPGWRAARLVPIDALRAEQ